MSDSERMWAALDLEARERRTRRPSRAGWWWSYLDAAVVVAVVVCAMLSLALACYVLWRTAGLGP